MPRFAGEGLLPVNIGGGVWLKSYHLTLVAPVMLKSFDGIVASLQYSLLKSDPGADGIGLMITGRANGDEVLLSQPLMVRVTRKVVVPAIFGLTGGVNESPCLSRFPGVAGLKYHLYSMPGFDAAL